MILQNFTAWRHLLSPLKLSSGLEKKPLKVEFLKIISMPKSLICVRTYVGINDLHKFVSVALHTSAGEGDYANDNLSRLKIVGSGYSPLIYDLEKKPSFENFKKCCVKVWDALKQNSTLPERLVCFREQQDLTCYCVYVC